MKPTRSTASAAAAATFASLLVVAVLATSMVGTASAQSAKASAYYEDALKQYELNDLPRAAIQLKNALQADPKMLAANLLLGKVLLRSRELKAAEAALEEALKLGVSKSEVAPLLGQVYLQLGEPRKVIDIVNVSGATGSQAAELLTLRGSAEAMMGNTIQASASFAKARNADPLSAAPLVAEAPVLLGSGDRDGARNAARKGTELAPKDGFAWYQYGVILHALGDLKPALAALDKAIVLSPKHADAHVSRAMVLLASGARTEAAAELAKLKEAKVREPRASWLRGMLAQDKGDAATAKAEFTDAINLIDPLPPAVRNASEPLLLAGALSHYGLGNKEKVREYLATLLSRNSRHYAAQLLMATVLIESKDYDRAMPLLEALQRATPDSAQVLYMIGSVHLARKQYAQAAGFLERASRQGGSSDALRELSFTQFGMGQNKLALANLEKAHAANPKDLRAGIELAVVYARSGQSAKAVQTAESLVKLDPDNLAMLNFLGNVKGRLGDRKGMREAYEQALAKDPKFRLVVMNLSWLDMDEGKLDSARARLLGLLKDNNKDPDLLLQLGILEQRARRPAEALVALNLANSIQNKDPRPGLAAVDVMLSQRQTDPALALARTLAANYPGNVTVLMTLARTQLQRGDRQQAKQALQEASKLAGFNPAVLVDVARLQLAAGDADGAQHAINKALQNNADDPNVLTMAVDIEARKGTAASVDKALSVLQSKHPNHPLTLITSGHVAMSRNQFAKAADQYRAVFNRQPSTPIAVLVSQALVANNELDKAVSFMDAWSKRNAADLVALRMLAELQLASGKAETAKSNFKTLLAAEPNNPALAAAYARALFRLKDPGATAMAETAHKLDPSNSSYADSYGWMLIEQGKVNDGVNVLRDARLRDPANGSVRWHLAAGLAKANRMAEARDELQSVLAAKQQPPPGLEVGRLRSQLGL